MGYNSKTRIFFNAGFTMGKNNNSHCHLKLVLRNYTDKRNYTVARNLKYFNFWHLLSKYGQKQIFTKQQSSISQFQLHAKNQKNIMSQEIFLNRQMTKHTDR